MRQKARFCNTNKNHGIGWNLFTDHSHHLSPLSGSCVHLAKGLVCCFQLFICLLQNHTFRLSCNTHSKQSQNGTRIISQRFIIQAKEYT